MSASSPFVGFGRSNVIHVIQGEYAVSDDSEAMICTLLGSCVSACICDPFLGVGGLNHFLLPEGEGATSNLSYGVHAMELLINDLLRRGANRNRLKAKLFGGARMIQSAHDIGAQNAVFAKEFLVAEGIQLTGGSLGGLRARRIEFWPANGKVRQQLIEIDRTLASAEMLRRLETPKNDCGSVELF